MKKPKALSEWSLELQGSRVAQHTVKKKKLLAQSFPDNATAVVMSKTGHALVLGGGWWGGV